MPLATVSSRTIMGIDAHAIAVEVDVSPGLPAFTIVGLPEAAIKESKDRVRSALLNSRFEFPAKRITVNLAPAELPKQGSHLELAIALGVLSASGQLEGSDLSDYEFVGELALGGQLRATNGFLPIAISAAANNKILILPHSHAPEAATIGNLQCFTATHLLDVCAHFTTDKKLPRPTRLSRPRENQTSTPCLGRVKGQPLAKRAMEIAAAGRHNMLMIGPPGSGKSMMAGCLPGILPDMSDTEALATASVYSVRNKLAEYSWHHRPFRAPHHTTSGVALVGGGTKALPGEISLAHNGILFLDELPEFDRKVLDVLREPLETGNIHVSRANHQATYPADFQLIAAMNPSPAAQGNHVDDDDWHAPESVKYRRKVSKPFLDRIDIQIEVPAVPVKDLQNADHGESSATIKSRVCEAFSRQLARCGKPNSRLDVAELETHCSLAHETNQLLVMATEKLGLSARGYHRILRVARTIADLAECNEIRTEHVSEAINFRRLEKLFH